MQQLEHAVRVVGDALGSSREVAAGVAVAFLLLAIWVGHGFSGRRLRRWCEQEGFELLDWRGAWFFEGPGAWLRSQYQHCYRIEVRDRDGIERSGFVTFGTFWLGWPFSRNVRVEWDPT